MKSQCDLILNDLKLGHTVTPLKALDRWGCFRLAARVKNLRDQGHKIHTRMITIGKSVRIASYSL